MKIEGLYIQNSKGDLINIENIDPSDYQSLFDYIRQSKATTERIDKELAELPGCVNTKCCDNENGMYCTSHDSTACPKGELLKCTNCECPINLKGKYCRSYVFTCVNRKPF